MELTEAHDFGNFSFNIDEFVAAYRSMGIHDRGEDSQDTVVADFRPNAGGIATGLSRMIWFDYFPDEDEEFKAKFCQYKIPGHFLKF